MESSNDYVIQVKGNAPSLYSWIKKTMLLTSPCDTHYTLEKNKGREEHREIRTYEPTDHISGFESCQTVIHTINHGIRYGNGYQEHHYYISNKKTKIASYYLQGIRGHWSIENSCHWVKDAILYEDNSRVKSMVLSENLSTLRHLVMNIYRLNNQKSIKKGIEKYCNRLNECLLLINRLHNHKT